MQLSCSFCNEQLDEGEFSPFSRNPALSDRQGRVIICKKCCSEYVEKRGNTKEALKEILRLIDVPYIEGHAVAALDLYERKKDGTNLVIRKNVYTEEETESVETNKIQNTIFTCYTSKLGLIPKRYINFSYSDGIRKDDVVEEKISPNVDKKALTSARTFMSKKFNEAIRKDKVKLAKAVKLMFDEISLHKNNVNKRQEKFKLKNHLLVLIENGDLDKKDYLYLYDDKDNDTKEIIEIEVDQEEQKENENEDENVDFVVLKNKWGSEYNKKDLIKFEAKYTELRRNYEIKTASHDEFLRLACIASVRANECMASKDVDGAKTWLGMFKDMTSAGKLQPNQMSKADLSGGLSNFGEFFKTVEQAKGVVDILPEMYESPRDKADFVIYCNIQYMRRLKGMPDVEYKEIYKFYEEMVDQFIDDGDDIDLESFFEDEGE